MAAPLQKAQNQHAAEPAPQKSLNAIRYKNAKKGLKSN